MFTTPKKESCLRGVPNRPVDGGTNPPAAPARSADRHLKWRDKALPDRLVIASLLCDTFVILYSLVFSFWLRFVTPISEIGIPKAMALQDYAGYIGIGTLALVFVLTYFGVYERSVLLRYRFVSSQIVKTCVYWAVGFLGFAIVFKFEPPISRIFVTIAAIVTPACLLSWRWIFHAFLHRSPAALSLRQRMLFVGWNEEADRLANAFHGDPGSAYEVVGCVEPKRRSFRSAPHARVLGQFGHLTEIIQDHSIDIVMLTDINSVRDDIVAVANACEREMVQFKVIPSYFQILVSGLHLETVSGIPVLGVSRLPLDRFVNILLKRAVDIVGSVVGLILTAPLVLIFGALVYSESRGPIFYRQRRLGRNGLEFDILKIRSMKLDAEVPGKVGWTTKDDPRRLKIGSFMRKTNIDELPQFWNVLKGEMSLVGPRPERPELIRNFKHEIPHYNARHNAKPGITGWAQVNGLRGDTDLTERIKCDLWYLENWNLFLDMQIMFLTLVKRENAC